MIKMGPKRVYKLHLVDAPDTTIPQPLVAFCSYVVTKKSRREGHAWDVAQGYVKNAKAHLAHLNDTYYSNSMYVFCEECYEAVKDIHFIIRNTSL